MLIKLNSVHELKMKIEDDLISNVPNAVRYPVRLIFINKRSTFKEVIAYLSTKSKIIEINNIFEYKDKWITPDEIKNIIKNINGTSTFIPFGEFLRFTDSQSFISLLNSIYEIENYDSSRRIYFPILGLKDEFLKLFFERFHRKSSLLPIWSIDENPDPKIKVFQLNKNLSTSLKIIKTTSEWMEVWKFDNNKLISTSSVIEYLYKQYTPDPIFNFIYIKDYKEFIENILDFAIPFEYKDSDKNFWEILSKKIEDNKFLSYEDFISSLFNKKDIFFNNSDCLKIWFQRENEFERWILKNHILYFKKDEDYLYLIFKKINHLSDKNFLEQLWFSPFREEFSVSHFIERKEILKFIHNELKISFKGIENEFSLYIDNIPEDKINLILTDITFEERKFILQQYTNSNHINISFPDLSNYLNWKELKIKEDWIYDYFREYNNSKIKNKKSDKLKEILKEKNKNAETFYNWYYELPPTTITNSDEIFWIDGLGAEWYPFVINHLKEITKNSDYGVSKIELTRVNLPSTTENNRFDNALHLMELDKFIHSQSSYSYPDDLLKQFEIIKNTLNKIIEIAKGRKISIVSDHGFSFLCRKEFENFKTRDFTNDNHEGRCMFTTESINSDKDFIVHKIDSGKLKDKICLIALNHKSLNKIPAREVHGGATPEEVIVPYIELKKKEININYTIQINNQKILLKNPNLEVTISPHPVNLPMLIINKKSYYPFSTNNANYSFSLKNVDIGEKEGKIIIGNKEYPIKFEIIGGIIENELF